MALASTYDKQRVIKYTTWQNILTRLSPLVETTCQKQAYWN